MTIPSVSTIWLIAGIVMIIAEFFLPGLIICFFGVSALIVGVLNLLIPAVSSTLSLLLFGLLSVILLLGVRRFIPKTFHGNVQRAVEDPDGDEVVGEKVVVTEEITPDRKGAVLFRGSRWLAASDSPHAVNETVVIVRRDNLTLIVR
ncbi:MAG: NfeD family protein [Kiritimatiellia bacterium]